MLGVEISVNIHASYAGIPGCDGFRHELRRFAPFSVEPSTKLSGMIHGFTSTQICGSINRFRASVH
jgi:hypothetical protein